MTVTIADDTTRPVAGHIVFVTPEREWVMGPAVCGSVTTSHLPEAWDQLQVHLAGVVESRAWCGVTVAGPAVTGEVRVTFHAG